jgi:hypothetical protein
MREESLQYDVFILLTNFICDILVAFYYVVPCLFSKDFINLNLQNNENKTIFFYYINNNY